MFSKKHDHSGTSAFNSRKGEDFFGVQAKLNIGKSNDKYEAEADKLADAVVSDKKNIAPEPFFTPSPVVQSKTVTETQSENKNTEIRKKNPIPEISPVIQPKLKVVQNKQFANSDVFFNPAPVIQKKQASEIQQKSNPEKETPKENAVNENAAKEKNLTKAITPVIQSKSEKKETVQTKIESLEAIEKTNTSKSLVQQKKEEDIQKKNTVEKVDTSSNKTDLVKPESPKIAEKNLAPKPQIQKKKEEEIQAKEEEEIQAKEEEKELQMSAAADANPTDNSNLESTLNNSKGGGTPMSGQVKNEMESNFGADFSNVRIHNDSTAVQMNQQLGAQAFANGSDVYFNEGKYNPGSQEGKHLLAHELTHTVQQGAAAAVQPKMIQKTTTPPAGSTVTPPSGVTPHDEANGEFSYEKGGFSYRINTRSSPLELILPTISISEFKARNRRLFVAPLDVPADRNTAQPENWNTGTEAQANRLLDDKISEATRSGGFSRTEDEANRVYFFKGVGKPDLNIFGTRNQLLALAKLPIWDRDKNATTFQIDHIVEHQLGGADNVQNYELLEASANGSSGSSIAWEMNNKIREAYDVFMSPYYQTKTDKPVLPARPGRGNQYVNTFKDGGYKISFLDFDFELPTRSGMPDRYWSYNEITQGQHLNKIQALTGDEMRRMGTEDDPALFISPNGGQRLRIPAGNQYPVRNWLPRVDLTERPDFQNQTLKVDAYKSSDTRNTNKISASYPNMTWNLNRIPNTYIFYVDKQTSIANAVTGTGGVFQSLRLPGMSPIQIDQMDLTEKGFSGSGKVLPTVPLISDADIDIVIDGDGVRLRKLFTANEFHFPAPFVIDNATLEVSFGTNGLGITGRVDFGINNVGTGHIQAAASMANGFALEGAFNFDSELFNPAEINVEYKDNIWTIGGRIGIIQGTIRGVKSATIQASYSENTFTASGEAELDIPGIRSGTMQATYNDTGFSIGGQFQLKDDIPGIRGGSVSANISKQDGEGYNVSVTGTAQPNIPGINSSLTVSYENGALTLSGSADYSRGMLSGTATVGATNRMIGEDGQPTGEPDDTMRVYGGGTLTLQLTPWLAATAGVKFLPNGEMEVTARLATDTYDVFPRKQFDRNLFTVPTIEIPLFAIPLGPRSLGLVAQVSGGLDFTAGFGPGQLRNLSAEITYNPEHEELTTITGHGEFVIPADAGLTMHGDLGLGLSIGIASLSGGIELAGTLGLEGEAGASVDLNWSPQTGLALDAEGHITVNPKFTFDINAFARASLGIGWFSISETWRYNLASFSWGPDIQFGLVFPIHYKEGEPFDISFDDIEVIYPELDVIDMAKDLASDVKDDIFD